MDARNVIINMSTVLKTLNFSGNLPLFISFKKWMQEVIINNPPTVYKTETLIKSNLLSNLVQKARGTKTADNKNTKKAI